MSERASPRLLVLALLVPGVLGAQSRVELEARLARLRADQAVLDSVLARRQARESAQRGWRSAHAGRLVVQYEAADATLGEEVAATAWDELARQYGGLLDRTDSLWIRLTRVRTTARGDSIAPEGRPLEVRGFGRTRPGMQSSSPILPAPSAGEDIVRAIVLVGGQQVWATMDGDLVRWHPSAPGSVSSDRQGQTSYIQLASSSYEGGHSCFAGDLASCARMLGLVAHPRDPVASYSPQERRVLARRVAGGYLPTSLQGPVRDCLDQGVQGACDAVLLDRPGAVFQLVPLDQDARGLLLTMAVIQGGEGALERLVVDSGLPLADRLAAAAGIPVDSLLSRWREAVMRSRPERVAVTAGGGWVMLGWSLAFFGLALGSSRWR